MATWYPQNKKELDDLLETFLIDSKKSRNQINGLIVPHAGYQYSGKIAGKAYSYLKEILSSKTKRTSKAIILSPSHYIPLKGIVSPNQKIWTTPLGEIKITKNEFDKLDISREHAIDNQVPFLQKLGFTEILPLLIGEITLEEAKEIADKIANFEGIIIISSDLSHFFPYEEASKRDQNTIKIIKSLNLNDANNLDACGLYPLLIFLQLAKIKKFKPKLIEYKNSGDITNDKKQVVGYSSFIF